MQKLSVLSPAKINLFLHITGQRDDGYHLLQSLFLLLGHGDTIHYQLIDADGISLSTDFQDISVYDNLISRAARALLPYRSVKKGVNIKLDKTLPTGAGLGGGSSNAATTLVALNELWQCNLSEDELANIGVELGADVPFFVRGYSAFVEGIGEQITTVETDLKWYLLITPPVSIETGKIFRHQLLTRDTPIKTIAAFLDEGIFTSTRNDCEALVRSLYPQVEELMNELEAKGLQARLTGTGSSVFVRFDNQADALLAQQQLADKWQSFVAQDIGRSPVRDLYHGSFNQESA